MHPELNQQKPWYMDLACVGIASFALLGMAGCSQQSAVERAQSRPVVEPEQILARPSEWVGKQVTIYGTPSLKEDRSSLRFSSGHLLLDLDLRYVLNVSGEGNGQAVLNVDKWSSFDVCGDQIPVKNPAGDYYLNEATTIVSGTIKEYKDGSGVYLHLDTSLVRELPKDR